METTRIRLLSESEIRAHALRNNNLGSIVVERYHALKGTSGGFYIIVSSHSKMSEAEKAKAKLDKKIAKG